MDRPPSSSDTSFPRFSGVLSGCAATQIVDETIRKQSEKQEEISYEFVLLLYYSREQATSFPAHTCPCAEQKVHGIGTPIPKCPSRMPLPNT